MVARTGYTGEQGVELLLRGGRRSSRSGTRSSSAASRRAASERATRCASRSATRSTATTSRPETDAISAGLGWACALDTDFTGVETRCAAIKEEGPTRKLVPFVMEERAVPRQGMPIEGGGEVTSGNALADARRQGIGMGYVPAASAQPDSELVIDVRGKPRRARVVKKPIYRKEQ